MYMYDLQHRNLSFHYLTGYQKRGTGDRKVPHFNPRTTKVTANLELPMCDKISSFSFDFYSFRSSIADYLNTVPRLRRTIDEWAN